MPLANSQTRKLTNSQLTLRKWRRADPEFSEAIVAAEAESAGTRLDIINNASQKSWRAAAWWLERKFPHQWAATRQLTVEDSTHPTKLGKVCRIFRHRQFLPPVPSEMPICRTNSGQVDCASTFRTTRPSVRTVHRLVDLFFAKKHAKHPNKPTKLDKDCRTLPWPRTKDKSSR